MHPKIVTIAAEIGRVYFLLGCARNLSIGNETIFTANSKSAIGTAKKQLVFFLEVDMEDPFQVVRIDEPNELLTFVFEVWTEIAQCQR